MQKVLHILMFFVQLPVLSQRSYSSDDYFNLLNASAFSEKKLFISNSINYGSIGQYRSIYNDVNVKYNTGILSLGISHQFQQFAAFKSSSSAFQIGYPLHLDDNITLNSGVRCVLKQDNALTNSDISSVKNTWNPYYLMLDFGLALQSDKWYIGIGGNNLNRPFRTIDTLHYRTPYLLSLNGSYHLKLDSLEYYSFTPSFGFEYDVINRYQYLFLSLQLKVFQHVFGICSFDDHHVGTYYEYHFKKHVNLGISFQKNQGSYVEPKQWNLMLRMCYFMKSNKCHNLPEIPSF